MDLLIYVFLKKDFSEMFKRRWNKMSYSNDFKGEILVEIIMWLV